MTNFRGRADAQNEDELSEAEMPMRTDLLNWSRHK